MSSNKTVVRTVALLVAACAAAVVTPGCGDSYSEEDAKAACNAYVGSVNTSGSEAYQQCVDCHVECGADCKVLESYPPQFSCPE